MKIFIVYMFHNDCGGFGCCGVSYCRLVLAHNENEAKKILIKSEAEMDVWDVEEEIDRIEYFDTNKIYRKRKPQIIY